MFIYLYHNSNMMLNYFLFIHLYVFSHLFILFFKYFYKVYAIITGYLHKKVLLENFI